MHLLPTLARLRIILLINGWGFVRTDIYLHCRREYIHSGSCFILLHITYTHNRWVCALCLMKYLCAPHDELCLFIYIESTDAVTSRRLHWTHSRGEGAYRSSCDGWCCWLGEYIHSGSYLILTLTTWVHPFWLISYTYTDDVSTSILAQILYLH